MSPKATRNVSKSPLFKISFARTGMTINQTRLIFPMVVLQRGVQR
jgi:hypothetical protein